MSEQLSFRFSLDDKVSGPAKNIRTGLEAVSRSLKNLGSGFSEAGKKVDSQADAFGKFNVKLNQTLEVASKLAAPFIAISEKVFDLGREFASATLKMVEFGQKSTIAFETMPGSATEAKKIMQSVVDTAATLPITTQEAVGYATNLITAGFKQQDLKTLITSISDIRALNPSDPALASDVLTRTFRNVRGQGFLDEREFRELGHIGVSSEKLTANIAKYLAIPLTDVREAVSKRQVGIDVGLAAILDTVKQEEGGRIGNLSNKLAETPTGLLSTIKSRFFEATLGLDQGAGFKALTGTLMNIRDLTDQTTESGRRLKDVIGGTFDAIFTGLFGKFAGAQGKATLTAIFDQILDAAQKLPDIISAVFDDIGSLFSGFFGGDSAKSWKDLFDPQKIRDLGPAFERLGNTLSNVVDIAGNLVANLGPILRIVGYGGAIGEGASLGATIGTAFGPGVGTAIGAAIGGTVGLAGAAFADHALTAGLPHHAAGGITTSEHAAVVGDGGPELIAPLPPGGLAGFGGGTKSIHVGEITVQIGDGHGGDQTVKEQVREGTLLALQQVLESMNLEMGGGVA